VLIRWKETDPRKLSIFASKVIHQLLSLLK
jgi:hypothetical protein